MPWSTPTTTSTPTRRTFRICSRTHQRRKTLGCNHLDGKPKLCTFYWKFQTSKFYWRFEDDDGAFNKPNGESDTTSGFKQRMNLFCDDDDGEFTTEWVQLSGRLHFDLESLSTGILPGTKVSIELVYSSDNFRLFTSETTTTYPLINDVTLQIGYVRIFV